jgi:heptosyltransferase-2
MLSAAHYAIILLGGAEDKKLCQRIASGVEGPVINSAGELSLRQTALLLKQVQALVTNDSAPLHLGSAANVPIVAIFGPTITGFGFYPYSDHYTIVETDLGCRPCGIHGGQKCPIGTHACMTQLSAENVFHEIITIIKQKTDHERNNKNKPPTS